MTKETAYRKFSYKRIIGIICSKTKTKIKIYEITFIKSKSFKFEPFSQVYTTDHKIGEAFLEFLKQIFTEKQQKVSLHKKTNLDWVCVGIFSFRLVTLW